MEIINLCILLLSIGSYYLAFFSAFAFEAQYSVLAILLLFALLTYLILHQSRKIKIIYLILLIILYIGCISHFSNGIKILLTEIFTKYAEADVKLSIPSFYYMNIQTDYRIALLLVNIPIVLSLTSYYVYKKCLLLTHLLAIIYVFIPIIYQYFPDYIYLTIFISCIFTNYLTRYVKDNLYFKLAIFCLLLAIPYGIQKIYPKDTFTKLIDFDDLRIKINNTGEEIGKTTDTVNTIDLSKEGNKKPTDDIELYITSDPIGSFKLKGKSYSVYENNTWTNYIETDDNESIGYTTRRILNGAKEHTPYHINVRTNLYIATSSYQPYFVTFFGTGYYTFLAYQDIYNNDSIAIIDMLTNEINSYVEDYELMYTQYPDYLDSILQQTLDEMGITQEDTPYEMVNKIRDYYSKNFTYSYTVDKIGEDEEFTDVFLTNKEGYCVHFATAATLLLRKAGVMARYVTGYEVDEYDNDGYIARNNDQHAWIEYFDPRVGWLPYEVTSYYEIDSSTATYMKENYQSDEDSNEENDQQIDVEINEEEQKQEEKAATNMTQKKESQKFNYKPFIVAAIILLVLFLTRVYRMYLYVKYKKQSTNQYVLFLYHQLDLLHIKVEDKELAYKAMYSNTLLTKEECNSFEAYYYQLLENYMNTWYKKLFVKLYFWRK